MKPVLVLLLAGIAPASAQIRFYESVLAADLKGGYQLQAVDMNGDGKPDLLALASGIPELVWFENPTWQRHVIAGGFNRMINAAPIDANGDGIPELILAHEFANVAKNSIGIVSLLESNGNPRERWKVREIDRLTTSHRLRTIRLPQGLAVINAPLTGGKAEPPTYRDRNPVVLYRPPEYKRELVDESIQGVMHGIFVTDWDAAEGQELLTASFEGVHLMRPARPGTAPEKVLGGSAAPWPQSGSSEIVVGHLGKERILATIDPWHGNEVAVYRRKGSGWDRQVIDTAELDGHTLHMADLDGDGRDEVIAGFRGPGRSVFYYQAARDGSWQRRPIDRGGIAAAGCAVADFNGDKRIDVACIGSATANLKLYRNLGTPGSR